MSTTTTTSQVEQTQEGRLKVAIIGAGMGGLTLAAALRAFDKSNKFEVNLYEAAHQISEIGVGIGMWPRTWKIMKELGFDEPLGHFIPNPADDHKQHVAWELRKSDQSEGAFVQNIVITGSLLEFHRADLQQTLLAAVPSEIIHLNKRLLSFEEKETPEGQVHLEFKDGSSATCDILIGMDGIKSVVRKGLLVKQGLSISAYLHPVWTGTIAYRGLIKKEVLEQVFPEHRTFTQGVMYMGRTRHLTVYPVQHEDGQVFINVAAFVTVTSKPNALYHEESATPVSVKDELLAAFVGWEPEVQALIQCMSRPAKWPIQQLVPLESYGEGCIVIGGDAAHAMPPHQGSGAGQAIEDAYLLANLLCHKNATKATIPKATNIYSTIRHPEGNRVLNASIRTGRLYELILPGHEDDQSAGDMQLTSEQLLEIAEHVGHELEWTWKDSAQNDRLRGLEMLCNGTA